MVRRAALNRRRRGYKNEIEMIKMAGTTRPNPSTPPSPICIVCMGVSCCGKTTVASQLARTAGCPFYDADDFHSEANISKMRSGTALTDEDRLPWLQKLHELLLGHVTRRKPAVLACSALRRAYRDTLTADGKLADDGHVSFVLLDPPRAVLQRHVESRQACGGHFMPAALLDSQLATLEYDEQDIHVLIQAPSGNADTEGTKPSWPLPAEIVRRVMADVGWDASLPGRDCDAT